MTRLKPLMGDNFLQYASYVIVDRAIPDLRDGLKPVQRRILATLSRMDDGKFHKVANVIGDTMKLHPHGDASIGDALVVLANKELLHRAAGQLRQYRHRALRRRHPDTSSAGSPTSPRRPCSERRSPATARATTAATRSRVSAGQAARAADARRRGHRGGHVHPDPAPQLLRAAGGPDQDLRTSPWSCSRTFPPAASSTSASTTTAHGKVKVRARIEEKDRQDRRRPRDPLRHHHRELHRLDRERAAQKGKVKIGAINDFTTDGSRSRSTCRAASTPTR